MKRQKLILLLTITFIGFYALIMQVTYIREILVICYGNELCLGLILGFWLFGISAGAFFCGKVSLKVKNPLKIFFFLLLILTFVFCGLVYFSRISRLVFEIPPGEYMPFLKMVLFIFLAVSPGGAFIGFTFPLICLAKTGDEENTEIKIANVYIFEAVGSISGGLLFTFFFVTNFSPFTIIAIVNSIAFAVLAILSLTFFRGSFKFFASSISILLFLAFLLGLITGSVNRIEELAINKRWNSFAKNMTLFLSLDSKYQNIAIGESKNQYNLFLNGQYASSFPDEYQHAVFANFVMSEHPDPKKVLLIGSGVTGVIKNILKYDIKKIDYLELDFKEIESLKKLLPEEDKKALLDKRLSIFPSDGRYYVKNCKENYDLIILNLPDPSTAMLNRFYTKEYFSDLKRLLNQDGVVITSITSQLNYLGKIISSYTGSIYKTLQEEFNFVLVAPGEKNIFFASDSKDSVTFDIKTLASRFSSKNIYSDYFTPFHFDLLLPADRVEFVRKKLSELKDLPLNTDERPITYFYSLILWDRLSGWKKSSGLQFADYVKLLSEIEFAWYLVPLLLFFLLRSIYIFTLKRDNASIVKFNSAFSIFAVGFAGMAFSIILIFAFQNIFGYVYQKIGFIVGTFMLGLATGGYFMKVLITKEIKDLKLLLLNLILIVAFSFSLPPLIEFFQNFQVNNLSLIEFTFSILLFIAGLLTGSAFPVASKVYFGVSRDLCKTAGIVDSTDHLGAFSSALLTGIFLVPVFGLSKTCIFIAVLNFVGVGLWVSLKK